MPKNSCFSTNEKRLPLFWPWETGFTFRFSNSFPYLKRVRKWSRLSTCFSELVSTFRRSNEMSRHFEVSFFRSENVSATAVSKMPITNLGAPSLNFWKSLKVAYCCVGWWNCAASYEMIIDWRWAITHPVSAAPEVAAVLIAHCPSSCCMYLARVADSLV